MPFGYNDDHVRHVIEDGRDEIRAAVENLVDRLIDNGAIRIPSGCCSVYEERKRIIDMATDVGLLSVLTTDCNMLDEETTWLYVGRTQKRLAEMEAV